MGASMMDRLRVVWRGMVEPPWGASSPYRERGLHWYVWLLGWAWMLAGVVLGALVAPRLVDAVGLAGTAYQDWLVIAFAVLAGFALQLLGWVALFGAYFSGGSSLSGRNVYGSGLLIIGSLLLPFAGVGYGIYLYLSWAGSDQRTATVAFVGGLLVKVFLSPFVKGLVTGALFRWFMKWLRGGKDTTKAT